MEKSATSTPSEDNTKKDSDVSPSPENKKNDDKSEDPETKIEEEVEVENASDACSCLNKISEEIDQFLSLLSTVEHDAMPPKIPDSVEKLANFVKEKIGKYESGEITSKWSQESQEDLSLLESVNRLCKLTKVFGEFLREAKYTESLNRSGTVLHRAMLFLEEEFRSLLDDNKFTNSDLKELKLKQSSFKLNHDSDSCALPEPDSVKQVKFPGYSEIIVSNLNKIATAMVAAGYETECYQVYSIARRNAFEESLNKLGLEKISIEDVQKMQWESLEKEIVTWNKVFKCCVNDYFIGEKKLCDKVFPDDLAISASLFSNLARSIVIQLVNFAEAVAMTKRSTEKLFKFLDMYESLRDLIPAMDGLFIQEYIDEIKSESSYARCRLGEASVNIFSDLETSIKNDNGKQPVPGGAVHPLTSYTMNYLEYACEYKDTLEKVFDEHHNVERSDSENDTASQENQSEIPSPFAEQLVTIMDLLDANLQIKSKLYKDLSLNYIFLMNNGRYIVQKIKRSAEIHASMGNTWCRKRLSDLRQYHKNYQRETWSKVLGCLKEEGLQVNGKVSKPVLKERFKSFNAMFEEIHKTQSSWVLSDKQLQSEIRVSISAVMIPAYRSFLGRFQQYLDPGRQTEKYIKYQPEDIETYIEELFDGNPVSMTRRR